MTPIRRLSVAVFLAVLLVPAWTHAREACWSGWGYRVEPGSLTFQSGRMLLVTDGPADWVPGARVVLYRLDPTTGERAPDERPLVIRPRRPSFGQANGNRTVDDVADVVGAELHLMLGMTRIGPASSQQAQRTLAWACGRGG
jgi:hypothetical protein